MGCKQSSAANVREPLKSPVAPSKVSYVPDEEQQDCKHCGRIMPRREYNNHTVRCDERVVTCWNSWCSEKVKQGEMEAHMEKCSKLQRSMCVKCGSTVLTSELVQHHDSCSLFNCTNCPERTIGRMLKYCPVIIQQRKSVCSPYDVSTLSQNFQGPSPETHRRVAQMQLLWRWAKAKVVLEDMLFRLVYKEMDHKKEGFAIYKRLQLQEGDGVPTRSRSILQPHVAAATSDHYFPAVSNMPIYLDHIRALVEDLTMRRQLLPYGAAWRVFSDATALLTALPNVVTLTPPSGARIVNGRYHQGGKIVVVGDIHGQLSDLLKVLGDGGYPSESTFYIFNGDFVDRGPNGVEVLLVLFSLLLAFPKYVTLNRGNHECDYMNEEYGFDVEVTTKYDRNMFRLIQKCFCALPLGCLIGTSAFVVHGGLSRRMGTTIDDIQRMNRFQQIPFPMRGQSAEDELFQDLMWSDPMESTGWAENVERGVGCRFGPDVTRQFCECNGIKLVMRSHEECLKGFQEWHNRRLVTVFSASNYEDEDSNYGAYAVLAGNFTEPSFHTYKVDREDVFQSPAEDRTMPSKPARRRPAKHFKHDVLRLLQERIFQGRTRLLAYFAKLDRTFKGSVWKIEWAEAMRTVLNLDLPWFFLRPYIVDEDVTTHRIQYSRFLKRFRSRLSELWIDDWQETMVLRVRRNLKRDNCAEMADDARINYNKFCSVMRDVDYTFSDSALFQMFMSFDLLGEGHLNGKILLAEVERAERLPAKSLMWDIDAVNQLESLIIIGRSQLPSIFSITRDRMLTREKFDSGMQQLCRLLKKPLTADQRSAMFQFLSPTGIAVKFDMFLGMFHVYDSNTVPKRSLTEMFGYDGVSFAFLADASIA